MSHHKHHPKNHRVQFIFIGPDIPRDISDYIRITEKKLDNLHILFDWADATLTPQTLVALRNSVPSFNLVSLGKLKAIIEKNELKGSLVDVIVNGAQPLRLIGLVKALSSSGCYASYYEVRNGNVVACLSD